MLSKALYNTLEGTAKSIKAQAFQRRENPALPADESNAAAPTQPTLLDRVRDSEWALGEYAALRPELFRQLVLVPKGWKVQYKRDPAKGVAALPVKWTQHVSTDFKIEGLPLEAGVATIAQPETYAPFHDFELLDSDGNRPAEGTDIARVEMRLMLLLEKLLEAVKVLAGSLPRIERGATALVFHTDTTSLSRLAIHLAKPNSSSCVGSKRSECGP